jgi:hypothetical protein
MAPSAPQPDWEARLPGEQWVVLDSVAAAERYLSTYPADKAIIQREPYPNPQGLFARILFVERVQQDRVYISPASSE